LTDEPLERFVSAVVLSPFALEGFVKVRSLSGETGHLLKLSSAVLCGRTGERVYRIEAARPIAGVSANLLVKFEGVDTPEDAARLSGAEIVLPRSQAAPLEEGEYYIEDLKGLRMINPDGREAGVVTGIIDGGGGQLAEVRLPSGDLKLVPFRNEFLGEINVEKKEIMLISPWILE
jgi:16S rRNA processing protein RimM